MEYRVIRYLSPRYSLGYCLSVTAPTPQALAVMLREAGVPHCQIAARAGVSRPLVTLALQGRRRLRPRVLRACVALLREQAARRREQALRCEQAAVVLVRSERRSRRAGAGRLAGFAGDAEGVRSL